MFRLFEKWQAALVGRRGVGAGPSGRVRPEATRPHCDSRATSERTRPGRGRVDVFAALRRKVVLVAIIALVLPSGAVAALHGSHYLYFGGCCGGAELDGTRAYISVNTVLPAAEDCLVFSSVVATFYTAGQLQAGLARCGAHTSLGGTCSLSNNFVKFVERIPHDGGSAVCYPHGAASVGGSYLVTVDETWDNGTWWTFISGQLYEGQSGYDNNVFIEEWGEHTGFVCAGWHAGANFATWQRYNYDLNRWITVQSSYMDNSDCWGMTAVSDGFFDIWRGNST